MTQMPSGDFPDIDLHHGQGHLVRLLNIRGNRVQVRQSGALRWLHFGERDIQALIDLRHPEQPQLPYTQAMITLLALATHAERLLNLGLGGACIERYLLRHCPALQLTTVESNPDVIHLCRELFLLPDTHPVILESAESYLSRQTAKQDLIFCDLHDGDCHAPCLYQSSFYGHVRRALSAEGLFVLNLLPESRQAILNLLQLIRPHFKQLWLLDVPQRQNLVLVGCASDLRSHDDGAPLRSSRIVGFDPQPYLKALLRLPPV